MKTSIISTHNGVVILAMRMMRLAACGNIDDAESGIGPVYLNLWPMPAPAGTNHDQQIGKRGLAPDRRAL